MKIPFLQIQANGLLTGNFMLQAQTPPVAAGQTSKASRMIYPTSGGLALVDAKASFTDVMETFSGDVKVKTTLTTPGLPSDWKGVDIQIPAGVPIKLTVSVGLVAEVSATRDNQFKASVGAFARADASVSAFLFSKQSSGACTDSSWLPSTKYVDICKDVFSQAGVTESQVNNAADAVTMKTKKTGPTVKTSFIAPTVTAVNDKEIVFAVGFYPMYADRPLCFMLCQHSHKGFLVCAYPSSPEFSKCI